MKGYVRQRGDAWQLAVYVGLDDRKRRQYIYETVTGTRRDAERRLAVLVVEVDGGRRRAAQMPLPSYFRARHWALS